MYPGAAGLGRQLSGRAASSASRSPRTRRPYARRARLTNASNSSPAYGATADGWSGEGGATRRLTRAADLLKGLMLLRLVGVRELDRAINRDEGVDHAWVVHAAAAFDEDVDRSLIRQSDGDRDDPRSSASKQSTTDRIRAPIGMSSPATPRGYPVPSQFS